MGMNTGILRIIVLSEFLIMLLFAEQIYSAFRTVFDIHFYASTYVIEVELVLKYIDNYGVVSIHASTNGVYAYGFLILKDPDEEEPHLYIYAGLQNETFNASLLKDKVFRARLAVSIEEDLVMVFLNQQVYRLHSRTPKYGLKKIYLSVFNATGREYDYPSIYISSIRIYGCNQTVESLYSVLIDFDKSIPCYTVSLVEDKAINIYEFRNRNVNTVFYLIVGLIVPTITTTLAVYVIFKKRRHGRGVRGNIMLSYRMEHQL
ncbi:MAG: hypothetical protein QXM54_00345 [Desulfurococcaceae archaeon]